MNKAMQVDQRYTMESMITVLRIFALVFMSCVILLQPDFVCDDNNVRQHGYTRMEYIALCSILQQSRLHKIGNQIYSIEYI